MGVPPFHLNMTLDMSFDNLMADTKIPKTSTYRMSPLHEVLWFNNTDDIEEFIKTATEENEIGDLLRTYDRDARSPLMYAIINKNTKALKMLLDAGAPVNYQDPQQVNFF
jgi:ankyrin repeat protein